MIGRGPAYPCKHPHFIRPHAEATESAVLPKGQELFVFCFCMSIILVQPRNVLCKVLYPCYKLTATGLGMAEGLYSTEEGWVAPVRIRKKTVSNKSKQMIALGRTWELR